LFDSLGPVSARWREVLAELQNGGGTLQRLLRDPAAARELQRRLNETAAVFDTLGAAAGVFTDLLEDEELKATLRRIAPRLSQVGERWAGGGGSAAAFAGDTLLRGQLDIISSRLSRINQRLESGQGTLGRLLNDRILAEELARTRGLLEDLREDLGSPADGGRGRFGREPAR
jgi:phospholipid/cholesterol/gamma-HCH transport system substrate-binding protein